MSTGDLDDPPGEDITPHCHDPKDPAYRAVHAAEAILNSTEALSPVRLAELEGLLKELAAVRWEEASASSREAGWGVWLRLALLKHGPNRGMTPGTLDDQKGAA